MKKYLAIIKTEFQRMLTYRWDYFGFRFANLLKISTMLIIWTVIFRNQTVVGGYTYEEMITYIVISWLFIYLTSSYGFEDNVAKDIQQGSLSNFLLKPISYVRYMMVLSFGRVSLSLSSGLLISSVLIFLFRESMIGPSSAVNVAIIAGMIFLGYFIRHFISILVGFISFWTVDIAGPYFSINILIGFLSGSYFPMSMLPLFAYKICLFFPFIYFIFIPTELYLGKISTSYGLLALGAEFIWFILLIIIIKIVWRRGLRKFEGVGI